MNSEVNSLIQISCGSMYFLNYKFLYSTNFEKHFTKIKKLLSLQTVLKKLLQRNTLSQKL